MNLAPPSAIPSFALFFIRFRHRQSSSSDSLPLPASQPNSTSFSVSPNVSPSILFPLSLAPSFSLSLPVLRRRSPLPHISGGGRKTPVSAFKISLMAATAARARAVATDSTECAFVSEQPRCNGEKRLLPTHSLSFRPFIPQSLPFNRCLSAFRDFWPFVRCQIGVRFTTWTSDSRAGSTSTVAPKNVCAFLKVALSAIFAKMGGKSPNRVQTLSGGPVHHDRAELSDRPAAGLGEAVREEKLRFQLKGQRGNFLAVCAAPAPPSASPLPLSRSLQLPTLAYVHKAKIRRDRGREGRSRVGMRLETCSRQPHTTALYLVVGTCLWVSPLLETSSKIKVQGRCTSSRSSVGDRV